MKSISVIIPAHNASRTLEATVRSALAQTRRIDEIIIVENGSSDDTLGVATALANAYPSVIQITSEPGVSLARNAGIAAAAGDYIGFLDADDTYRFDAIATLAHFLDKYNVDFVKGNLLHNFADHTRIWRPSLRTYNTPSSLELDPDYSDFVGIYCGLYRRELLRKFTTPFPEGVHTAEDRVFVWKTLLDGARFIHVDKVVYNYDRTSETSVLKKVDGPHFDLFKAYGLIASHESLGGNPAVEYKFWLQYVSMMEFSYRAPGRLSEAGKKTWLNLSRDAVRPIVKSGMFGRIRAKSNKNRRAFMNKLA